MSEPLRPVVLTLTAWMEDRLKAIYSTTTAAAFDEAFDAFLAKHAHITVNGKQLSREHYKQHLRKEKNDELSAKVTISDTVEVPANSAKPSNAGNVGVFFTAAITNHLIKTSNVNSSLNVIIIQDEHVQQPGGPIGGGVLDIRRVSALSEVSVDQPETGLQPGIVSA